MLKTAKISILGCGWLGMPLAKELIEHGYHVLGSTTTDQKLEKLAQINVVPYLIRFTPDLQDLSQKSFFNSDTLIINIPPKRKSGHGDLYFQQMEEIVKECLTGEIRNVLFISSTSVYGEINGEVTEEAPIVEDNALSKAEMLLKSQNKFQTTVLRFGGLVGPDRHPGRFLAGKKDIPAPNAPVNIIHQEDCIQIILQILKKSVWGNTFNASADLHPTKKDFYTQSARKLNLDPPEFAEAIQENFKIINSKKLKHTINYQFIYPNPMDII